MIEPHLEKYKKLCSVKLFFNSISRKCKLYLFTYRIGLLINIKKRSLIIHTFIIHLEILENPMNFLFSWLTKDRNHNLYIYTYVMISVEIITSFNKICLIMAKATQRISVIRIPRQVLNQINPNVDKDDSEKDTATSLLKASDPPRLDGAPPNNREQNVRLKSSRFLFLYKLF